MSPMSFASHVIRLRYHNTVVLVVSLQVFAETATWRQKRQSLTNPIIVCTFFRERGNARGKYSDFMSSFFYLQGLLEYKR